MNVPLKRELEGAVNLSDTLVSWGKIGKDSSIYLTEIGYKNRIIIMYLLHLMFPGISLLF